MTKSSNNLSIKFMEDLIFDIFIFCMTIITGVILLEPYKWLFNKAKICIRNPIRILSILPTLLTIKILSILATLSFVVMNYLINVWAV